MSQSERSFISMANLVTLHFDVQQVDDLCMPKYSGSMLRGAFGTALRAMTCVTDLPACKACPLKTHCRFPRIFERPALMPASVQAVNPYVLHTPPPSTYQSGDIWHFKMSIMGDAIGDNTLIIRAWQQALAQGLGVHAPFQRARLLYVRLGETLLFDHSDIDNSDKNSGKIKALPVTHSQIDCHPSGTPASVDQLNLQFLTPFRHQQKGRIVNQAQVLDTATFLASLYNRIRLCQRHHSPDIPWRIGYEDYHAFKADILQLDMTADVRPANISRRSSRQQRKIHLHAMDGCIHLSDPNRSGALERLLPALRLGELLHIGKSTTLGLGQYKIIAHEPYAQA